MYYFHHEKISLLIVFFVFPTLVFGDCTCDYEAIEGQNREALKFKIGAIVSILLAGAFGVSLPILGNKVPALRPENDIFFMIKAFAAGVILATGFTAMLSAIGTLMIDSFATGYYKRQSSGLDKQVGLDEETAEGHTDGHVHVHSHGHSHGSSSLQQSSTSSELIRHRIVAQVLELGIVVHSVIIGITLGASQSPETIKPLIAALSFHQFFEGMGLGGCIVQAKFKIKSILMMAAFFSLTTPVGIAIGIGISSVYNENSPTSLIVEGLFNAAAAGILIYMALVDLLAADFMNPRMLNNIRLQLGANLSLLLGAGCMSVLAKWA
uniref:Uncharacterized protein n=1 Tax=Cannabis sativa TaxID=3483 RepID=A0A803NRZ2_CANSA